ncbi:sigma-54 dependent transcriptional regulator [Rubinisphaera sp.]|uniref:sigma-54-dependent transcriptional regulator n=1 Tax=Rubinisphaera sp. TaxID=2024857 RepID=UPI000C11241F|nr:sigma-54 dependent transcriptional regulator [Rubinisphaera sp.]MBV07639.1 transcriptional regulator [Rubinisphaera sp.]|tara:strand:- start:12054 stop:13463 length:1410 start_codon:yes stop_codon:yes gene_type:complete
MSNILIVDDEPSICWALEQALAEDGHIITTTATAEDALEITRRQIPDVVVMDIRLPGIDGLTALEQLQSRIGATPVIMITAFGNLETAVKAINRGAYEYLTKPFDLEDAIQVIRKALNAKPRGELSTEINSTQVVSEQELLGKSPAMQAVFRKIAVVAERDVPVLVTGESGTGKELVAVAIHRYSKRSTGPFIPVCVPAMNVSVIESELFGHAKGSFTGAITERHGLLEAANQGTAFFDEIGDIEMTTQIKLLRVLETKMISPVGGNDQRSSDFRLVAATNRNLEAMVAEEKFREDLFYRLNVFRIEIPPLRERPEDIPLLAEHFMRNLDPTGEVQLSPTALKELNSRPWNGNVRELRNVIEHAVIVTRSGEISAKSFPPPTTRTSDDSGSTHQLNIAIENWWNEQLQSIPKAASVEGLYEKFLTEAEPTLLSQALRLSKGNRTEAAQILGIHRQTLREKLKNANLSED